MNNINIIGRLTKDVTLSTTNSGVNYARFNVAVPSEIKQQDEEPNVNFFVCVAWRNTAENIAKYCKKGRQIALTGSMESRSYQGQDGQNRTIWELNVTRATFIGSASDEEQDQEPQPPKTSAKKSSKKPPELEPYDPKDDDDLPF